MQLVLDPVWLSPPSQEAAAEWLKKVRPIRELLAAGDVRISCPKALRNQMLARWFEKGTYDELIRTMNELEGRLTGSVKLDKGDAIFDRASASPEYTWGELDGDGRRTFIDHLAEAALAKDDSQIHFGVLSPADSWSEPKRDVLVEAEVLQRETADGQLSQPKEEEAALRAFLPRSEDLPEFFSVCSGEACALAVEPQFGVEAYFVGALGGSAEELQFEIGSSFQASVRGLGIDKVASNARTLLRTMALIASGHADQVEGHEERVEAAPASDIVRYGGDPVIRSYVNNHTPNALRLFWARGEIPLFLNVTGHEGSPALRD